MVIAAIMHHSQFWPDAGRLFSAIAAFSSSVATLLVRRNHQTLTRVEVKVNGELHGKIAELANVAEQLRQVTEQRDTLQAQVRPGGQRVTDPK